MSFRIIVTGSRNWTDEAAVELMLRDSMGIDGDTVVVQGGAAGADEIAARVARKFGWQVETFAADWGNEGKAAGPRRNRRMLDAGADVVVGFPIGGRATSPGTWDCLEAAAERGIPLMVYPRASLEETKAKTGGF